VGRISEVGPKRWKVDIATKQDAVLHLTSINLPGGILRRRTTDDELQMRTFFTEGDLLVAEVQQLFSDGAASLHTRSLKYGKLRNGMFVSIPPMLVVRSKAHMYSLGDGVHCILGTNGYVWVSKDVKSSSTITGSITRIEEEASEAIYSNKNEVSSISYRAISHLGY
jgi:exosome complex component RRP4